MRSRKKRGTTKYICKSWRSCQYALKKKDCEYGYLYLPSKLGFKGGYKSLPSPQCNGIKVTKEIEFKIKILML